MAAVIDSKIPDDAVRAARSLLQNGRLAEATEACQSALATHPDHRDALYTLAVVQRMGRKHLEALTTLGRLTDLAPSYGRAWQERGHCLRDLGRPEDAFTAYQTAVTHNGALAASWRMLAQLHSAAGRDAQADFATAQFEYLTALPPELQSVASLTQEGQIGKAETLCRAFLQKNGHHVEAMRLLADIGLRFNAYDCPSSEHLAQLAA